MNTTLTVSNPLISLIVATINRVEELDRLLVSLETQVFKDFEVLLVDQNLDDRIAPIIERHSQLSIQRLRSLPGLSRARNVALRQVRGDIICFPDDDCWYPTQLLAQVRQFFDTHLDIGGLFATLRDADNRTIGPKWMPVGRFWTKEDVWTNGISPAGFIRKDVADTIGPFDERLGVGAATPYQSGEDADYFIRVLEMGTIWYEPALTVHHPPFHRIERMRERSYSYSLGGGYTLRRHHFPFRRFAESFVRSIGGCAVCLFACRFLLSYCYLLRAAGLTRGYLLGPADLRKIRT